MYTSTPLFPKHTILKDTAIGTVYLYIRPGNYSRPTGKHLLFSVTDKRIKFLQETYIQTLIIPAKDLVPLHIYEIQKGNIYVSPSGIPFQVIGLPKHGQACTEQMVTYQAMTDTSDLPAGSEFVISESLFLSTFREIGHYQ